MVILHPDAVAQDRAARIGTRGIDGNNPYGVILLSIELCNLIDQRALTRPRRSGQANYARRARVREQGLQQSGPSRVPILDGSNGAGQCSSIAGTQSRDRHVVVAVHDVQCKARRRTTADVPFTKFYQPTLQPIRSRPFHTEK